jgi:dienelactone hydrolase
MLSQRTIIRLLAIGCVIAALAAVLLLSISRPAWRVTDDGLLDYPLCSPEYQVTLLDETDNYTLSEVRFTSRDTEISGLLRMPRTQQMDRVAGVVLLPGATVSKEGEQGLASYLCSLGYASIALDQRNLGVVDLQHDLQLFLNGEEPFEHKMVYDALVAAVVLREQPGIDPDRIMYAGESNGARFAIIACALDLRARGVLAISTCGYGVEAAIASGRLTEPDQIRFYRSVDPETYLSKIPSRKFVLFHSVNDTIIAYEYAERTYTKALAPKELHTVTCATHGYCSEMADALKTELAAMVS